ncbi:hemolysin XhlA family protein [Tuberibacillus sp. Marseille-P3662]|uniref:hemolysin XhlA family protein n=1 Tax=Tuberibacillus sp. Marseille-P3662 TaxID=1965358 RepID=UPI000A1C877B|nr:hemolysin XhlA family protein [Tuberibacillus sp. Marseille-P3662]
MEDVKDMDMLEHSVQQNSENISDLKESDKQLDKRITALETNDKLQDRNIQTLETSLGKIQDDTTWLRRTITRALITAGFGAAFSLVGGLILYFLTK